MARNGSVVMGQGVERDMAVSVLDERAGEIFVLSQWGFGERQWLLVKISGTISSWHFG